MALTRSIYKGAKPSRITNGIFTFRVYVAKPHFAHSSETVGTTNLTFRDIFALGYMSQSLILRTVPKLSQ